MRLPSPSRYADLPYPERARIIAFLRSLLAAYADTERPGQPGLHGLHGLHGLPGEAVP